jgi:hypothetical protein
LFVAPSLGKRVGLFTDHLAQCGYDAAGIDQSAVHIKCQSGTHLQSSVIDGFLVQIPDSALNRDIGAIVIRFLYPYRPVFWAQTSGSRRQEVLRRNPFV